MKTKLTLSLVALAVLACLATVGLRPVRATGNTLYVDDDQIQCPNSFQTVQAAVNAATPGDTVQVCAGVYHENVVVNKPLTLSGAQAGNPVAGRTFGIASEATIMGAQSVGASAVITITASGVTVDGFSLADAVNTVGAASGFDVKNTVNGALITNNILDGISTSDTSGNGTAQAVYLEAGPDNVQILNNRMNNVHSNRSAKGVLIGDSNSTNPSLNVVIQGNTISNVTSDTRGAYGVQINNGNGATANTGLKVQGNTMNNLTGGGWVHAVGLEANTPGVVVTGNSISNVSAPGTDRIAVWFESKDTSFSTGHVNQNSLDVTIAAFGIAVQPALSAGGSVDGTCNWWGSAAGPGPVGPDSGSQVSPNVIFKPWLIAPGGACIGGNVPTNKDQCKNDGWQTHVRPDGSTFKNQGDCIQYVNTGK
jgi:hypothetical protein